MPFHSEHCALYIHGRGERRGLGVTKLSIREIREGSEVTLHYSKDAISKLYRYEKCIKESHELVWDDSYSRNFGTGAQSIISCYGMKIRLHALSWRQPTDR